MVSSEILRFCTKTPNITKVLRAETSVSVRGFNGRTRKIYKGAY